MNRPLIILCLVTIMSPFENDSILANEPVPRGERILSIDVNEAEGVDYDSSFRAAKAAGIQATSLSIPWDEIETAPGVFKPEPDWLLIADMFYPAQEVKISLTISVLDTNQVRVPKDLQGKPFDAPEVIDRFLAALDYIFEKTPNLDLDSIAIGNEIDGVLGTDSKKWSQYLTFFESAAKHIRQKKPNLKVGAKAMFSGLVGDAAEQFQKLNQTSDVVMLNYYPLNDAFYVKSRAEIAKDFEQVFQLYPRKPIYLLEVGCPSGVVVKSSPDRQRDFVEQVFKIWDDHSDQLELVSFTWLNDISPALLGFYERYYGSGDKRFLDYLATLGLRTNKGKPKPAFQSLLREAQKRGW